MKFILHKREEEEEEQEELVSKQLEQYTLQFPLLITRDNKSYNSETAN